MTQSQPAMRPGRGCFFCGLKQSKGREVLWEGHWARVCRHCWSEAIAGRLCYADAVQKVMLGRETVRRKPLARKLTKEDRERQLVLKLGLPGEHGPGL